MGLPPYVSSSTAAALCGLSRRTFVAHTRPLLITAPDRPALVLLASVEAHLRRKITAAQLLAAMGKRRSQYRGPNKTPSTAERQQAGLRVKQAQDQDDDRGITA
jgi:hypothetical protein